MVVSPVSLGCWAIGGSWGPVDDAVSARTLRQAVDAGVNFFDTADVYGDGRSERLVGELLRSSSETLYVGTKAGRRLNPHTAEGYNLKNLTAFVERSLKNLGVEALDLLQLHCPPTSVYYQPETFGALDELVKQGKLRFYGVSVERVEEALKAVEFPGVQSVQIIYNVFRQRPAERFFALAKERQVGILARVPLASGLLTGKLKANSTFSAQDHRNFNRHGESFDVGETFSGVDYELGLTLVETLKTLVPADATLAQWALRWILMEDAVTCAIPGARTPEQVLNNTAATALAPLSADTMAQVKALYDAHVKATVHQRW